MIALREAQKNLAKVDVPASENEEPYPIGPDPKIWKGSWH